MKKGIIVLIAIAVLVAFTIPAMAETCFNEMSKCISTWKCPMKGEAAKAAAAPAKTTCVKPACTTDALNNKVPTATVNK